MAAVSLFTPPSRPPWRHVNILYGVFLSKVENHAYSMQWPNDVHEKALHVGEIFALNYENHSHIQIGRISCTYTPSVRMVKL